MKRLVVRAHDRAKEDKGWLKVETCFNNSFFKELTGHKLSTLVSLNEICIKPNMGFVPHKHENKDYIIIPLKGALFQRTSDGNEYLIENRCLQFMQTGVGISHYEFNPSFSEELICLSFETTPAIPNLEPVCETIKSSSKNNKINKITPKKIQNNPKSLINKVICSWGSFSKKQVVNYTINSHNNGILLYMVNGKTYINGLTLTAKDTIVIWNVKSFYIIADKHTDFIIFDFPFQMN